LKVNKVVVVDGFSDLPFSLGTPPLMGAEVRYLAGACWDRDENARVIYVTLDDLKTGRKSSLLDGADLVFAYAGVRQASPLVQPSNVVETGQVSDIREIADYVAYLKCPKILGGPYVLANNGKVDDRLGFDVVVTGDLSKYAHELLAEGGRIDSVDPSLQRTNQDLATYSLHGAGLAIQSAGYPSFLSCVVELYRGCPSASLGGCSFCHETRFTTVDYRPVQDVLAEISKLSELGCENVVLECPCFFSYFSSPTEDGQVKLDHAAIEKLLEGARTVAPDLKGLHIANANPRTIVEDPEESVKILKAIVANCSDANFINLRVITFDEEVQLQNNTPASADQSRRAVEMLAEQGRPTGPSGLPRILPTIELVYGLPGERQRSLDVNLRNLRELADAGLIRGVIARPLFPIPGTPVSKREDLPKTEGLESHLKELQAVNRAAEARLIQPGQLVREVYTYRILGGLAMAKKVGVNGLEVRIHGSSQANIVQDVRITSAMSAGLEALTQPLTPKTVSRELLRLIPEMTDDRIDRFMRSRPEQSEQFYQLFDDPAAARRAASFFEFKEDHALRAEPS